MFAGDSGRKREEHVMFDVNLIEIKKKIDYCCGSSDVYVCVES